MLILESDTDKSLRSPIKYSKYSKIMSESSFLIEKNTIDAYQWLNASKWQMGKLSKKGNCVSTDA